MPRGWSDVASAHREAEQESSRSSPYEGEIVADGVDRGRSSDTQNGLCSDAADDSHEDRSEEVVGARQETPDETTDGAHAADDQHCLNRGCL